jgi:nonsense-mediated mRNA decay protein 3
VELPNTFEVERCPFCGAIRVHGRYVDKNVETVLRELAEEYVTRGRVVEGLDRIRVLEVRVLGSTVAVRLSAEVGGVEVVQELSVELRFRKSPCPRCLRVKSRSYEAIVQLRAGNPRGRALVTEIAESFRNAEGVVEVKEVDEGMDIYVADKATALRIVRDVESKYVVRVVATWKDSRIRDGRRKSKAVYSVRVYFISSGGTVELRGRVYTVEKFGTSSVTLVDRESGEKVTLSLKEFWKLEPNIN